MKNGRNLVEKPRFRPFSFLKTGGRWTRRWIWIVCSSHWAEGIPAWRQKTAGKEASEWNQFFQVTLTCCKVKRYGLPEILLNDIDQRK